MLEIQFGHGFTSSIRKYQWDLFDLAKLGAFSFALNFPEKYTRRASSLSKCSPRHSTGPASAAQLITHRVNCPRLPCTGAMCRRVLRPKQMNGGRLCAGEGLLGTATLRLQLSHERFPRRWNDVDVQIRLFQQQPLLAFRVALRRDGERLPEVPSRGGRFP